MKITNYKKIISANWKMNGSMTMIDEFKRYFSSKNNNIKKDIAIILCPPFPYLTRLIEASLNKNVFIGAQDCSINDSLSMTGNISASILKDIGCKFVILGHSERRILFNETNEIISNKVKDAIKNNLSTIVCVGETESEKRNNKTLNILEKQINDSLCSLCNANNTIIAYEPVWAIGTGTIPSIDEIIKINTFIKKILDTKYKKDNNFKIIYGGSVKPINSRHLLSQSSIDGALVGGSSLIIADFGQIINF
tara:strand:- start:450 stop:1202 length:753 start_codon:yes stop_codon:yes gene_type:complete